ncbi:hypothetical protein ACROYT_G023867 [Oculina patagonica]
MAHGRVMCLIVLLFSEFSSCIADSADPSVWDVKDNTKFGVAEPNLEDSVLDVDLTSQISFRYQTNDGRKIFVFDKIFKPRHLSMFSDYLNLDLGSWQFRLYEPYDGGVEKPTDNIPWINPVDCVEFSRTLVGKSIQKAVMDAAGTEDIYYPYKVRGKIMRRGDFTQLFTDANRTDDEYSAMMFLNPKWRKNDYGELYLYDEDNEIVAGAVPKFGRVVVWQSSVAYLPRPPSIAFKKGQLLLHVQFTKSKEKMLQDHAEIVASRNERKAAYDAGFIGSDRPAPADIDVAKHFVSVHKSSQGKKILVFDDLFDKEDLDKLRAFIFKHGFEINDYIQSRLWNIMQQTLKHMTGRDKWFPYDISCNLIRSADHTRIHQDCEPHEDEWTYLIYLTPNWTKNDYGETAFYETMTNNNEIITEVRPKYGRAVVFQGIIPHSARPPSTNQSRARLTFVAKVSVNEMVGREKAFKEEMRHFQPLVMSESMPDLMHRSQDTDEKEPEAQEEQTADGEHEERESEPMDEEEENEEEEDPREGFTDEEEPDHPVLKELNQKLEEVRQSGSLDQMRNLHSELHARHVMARQEAVKQVANMI